MQALIGCWLISSAAVLQERLTAADEAQPPNIVLIFADDLGYRDLGCFGAQGYSTPHLDRLAADGRKFTSFYVSQAVCGASRASLLTGCYANRIGMLGAPGPNVRHGIHPDEQLLPELCRQRGYATAMYGKWHLGHHRESLPIHHGFDDYFGLPYSNDMWPFHPENPQAYPPLPLIEGDQTAISPVTPELQTRLTTWYTERAVKFIDQHHAEPFFVYVAHAMPHVPLFVSEKFAGKSPNGLYGDVISEIDWGVGEIVAALERHRLRERTLIIFTSDNGPWLSYGHHAGSAGPLREGKGTTFEGGVRVPCVMNWPGRIPAGTVCDELTATIDLLPTIAGLIGAELPARRIDGLDIAPQLLQQPAPPSPHASYLYYWGQHLQAIRSGRWKLHFPHDYRSLVGPPGRDGKPSGYAQRKTELSLYDLAADVGETTNVAAEHPEIVARLQALAEAARDDLGDSAGNRAGRGRREPQRFP